MGKTFFLLSKPIKRSS